VKKKIVEKPPRNSAIFNGRRLRRRPRPKLGCRAKERERVICYDKTHTDDAR
jgi:hypothetical protein